MVKRDEIAYLEARATLWQLVMTLLKLGHSERLPKRQFGPDLQLYFVFGSAVVAIYNRRPVTASAIARYLALPRETTRRHLMELVRLGLLVKHNGGFAAGVGTRDMSRITSALSAVQVACAKLL